MSNIENEKTRLSPDQLRRLKRVFLLAPDVCDFPSAHPTYDFDSITAREIALRDIALLNSDFLAVFNNACAKNKAHLFLLLYEDFLAAAKQLLCYTNTVSPPPETVRDFLRREYLEHLQSQEEALLSRARAVQTQLQVRPQCASLKRNVKALNERQRVTLQDNVKKLNGMAEKLAMKRRLAATDAELIRFSKPHLSFLLPRRRNSKHKLVPDLNAELPAPRRASFDFESFWAEVFDQTQRLSTDDDSDDTCLSRHDELPLPKIRFNSIVKDKIEISVEFEDSFFEGIESLHYRSSAALFSQAVVFFKAIKTSAIRNFFCCLSVPKGWTFFQFRIKSEGKSISYPIYFLDETRRVEMPEMSGFPQHSWEQEYSELHDLLAVIAAKRQSGEPNRESSVLKCPARGGKPRAKGASKTASKRIA